MLHAVVVSSFIHGAISQHCPKTLPVIAPDISAGVNHTTLPKQRVEDIFKTSFSYLSERELNRNLFLFTLQCMNFYFRVWPLAVTKQIAVRPSQPIAIQYRIVLTPDCGVLTPIKILFGAYTHPLPPLAVTKQIAFDRVSLLLYSIGLFSLLTVGYWPP